LIARREGWRDAEICSARREALPSSLGDVAGSQPWRPIPTGEEKKGRGGVGRGSRGKRRGCSDASAVGEEEL